MYIGTISVTVPSEQAARDCAAIAASCYDFARLAYVGAIGGYIHEAAARIEVRTTEENRRAACGAFVDKMTATGRGSYIY